MVHYSEDNDDLIKDSIGALPEENSVVKSGKVEAVSNGAEDGPFGAEHVSDVLVLREQRTQVDKRGTIPSKKYKTESLNEELPLSPTLGKTKSRRAQPNPSYSNLGSKGNDKARLNKSRGSKGNGKATNKKAASKGNRNGTSWYQKGAATSNEVLEQLRTHEEEYVKELTQIERNIFELETDYLRLTNGYGNVVQGFTKLLKAFESGGKTPLHYALWKKMSEQHILNKEKQKKCPNSANEEMRLVPKRKASSGAPMPENESTKEEGPPPGYIPVEWETTLTSSIKNPFKEDAIENQNRMFSFSSTSSPLKGPASTPEGAVRTLALLEEQKVLTEQIEQKIWCSERETDLCDLQWKEYLKRRQDTLSLIPSLTSYTTANEYFNTSNAASNSSDESLPAPQNAVQQTLNELAVETPHDGYAIPDASTTTLH